LSIFSSPYFIGRENTAAASKFAKVFFLYCDAARLSTIAIKVNSSFQNL
jgi:hypothetical protein